MEYPQQFEGAKKSLGQNFLTSVAALEKIIEAAELTADDVVLEAGPGKGILTERLLARAKKVIAVEKDDRLISFLQEKFKHEIASGNFVLIHGDILEFDSTMIGKISDLDAGRGETAYPTEPYSKYGEGGAQGFDTAPRQIQNFCYKIVANIPYYITGIFLRKFLEEKNQPKTMVLMLQKEVAERIVARDGKESILSISVKAYGTPKFIQTVKAGSFSPAPNVDSAILAIYTISKSFFKDFSEQEFFELLKTSFSGKRKTLKNNLKKFLTEKEYALENSEEFFGSLFASIGLDEKARAETLTLETWSKLTLEIAKILRRNQQ